jgi:hypothetical protein
MSNNYKLILHIGYPKTATTTLQNVLFYNLDKKVSKINFLGTTKPDISEYHNKLRQTMKPWLISEGKNNENELFLFLKKRLKNGLNLCSEESLLNSYQNPPYLFNPRLLKKLLSKITNNIQIIIVLRNQQEMIYSLFAHAGGKYSRSKYKSSDEWINYCLSEELNNKFFNYYDVIKNYQNIFNEENVNVLFFEDLRQDSSYFLSKLAKILEQPLENVLSNLGNAHLWKKEKSSDGAYYKNLKNTRKWNFLLKTSLFSEYIKKSLIKLNLYDGLRLIFKRNETFKELIPIFTDQQNSRIKKHFYENNFKLSKLLECDAKKLRKYNYF